MKAKIENIVFPDSYIKDIEELEALGWTFREHEEKTFFNPARYYIEYKSPRMSEYEYMGWRSTDKDINTFKLMALYEEAYHLSCDLLEINAETIIDHYREKMRREFLNNPDLKFNDAKIEL